MSQSWPAPATESQLGLVVLHQSIPVPHLYNVVVELRIDPHLPASGVRKALTDLLAVQPALRLSLNGPVATLIDPPAPADLPLAEIITGHAFDSELNAALEALKRTAFQLDRPPLLKIAYIVDDMGRDAALVLVIHHLIFDGASISPLIRDIDAALAGTLDVPPLRRSRERALARELHAQARATGNAEVDQQARAIGARLRDMPALTLYPRPGRALATAFAGRRIRIDPSRGRSAALNQTFVALGVTPFVFFRPVRGAACTARWHSFGHLRHAARRTPHARLACAVWFLRQHLAAYHRSRLAAALRHLPRHHCCGSD